MNQAEDGDAVGTNMAEERYGKMDGRRDFYGWNLWKDGLGWTSVPL